MDNESNLTAEELSKAREQMIDHRFVGATHSLLLSLQAAHEIAALQRLSFPEDSLEHRCFESLAYGLSTFIRQGLIGTMVLLSGRILKSDAANETRIREALENMVERERQLQEQYYGRR